MNEDETARIVREWAERTANEMRHMTGRVRAATGERDEVLETVLDQLHDSFNALADALR